MEQGIPHSFASQPNPQDSTLYYSTQFMPNDIPAHTFSMAPNPAEMANIGIDPTKLNEPLAPPQPQIPSAEIPPQIPAGANATQPAPGTNFDAFPGIYSSSGFDLFGLLARLADRPNKQIELGPVDLSCAFLVVDARRFDFPILYASPNFEKLTGYTVPDTIGRNCRFLQAPNGHVTLGSRRRYTDNSAVHQLKARIVHGKEHQISLVNYKKDGTPFMNLVTVIPISIGDEITFFIGLQVDLVEQPNAILDRMKDGTYAVNYSQITIPQQISPPAMSGNSLFANMAASSLRPSDIYESIVGRPRDENSYLVWNQILVNHCDDFVHVLTMKGVFLFSSPSTQKLLGYSPEDLVGNSISQYCHPSDYTPMLRELKDAADSSEPFSLVYRIRHKDGHYLWMESLGRLYLDKSKGRKFLILSGRIRPLYQLSMNSVVTNGGFVQGEFWSKLSLDGMFLFVTSGCQDSLDMEPQDFIGTSMYQFVRSDRTTPLTRALQQARDGVAVRINHHLRGGKGLYVNVVSTMYPGDVFNNGKPAFILCQTRPTASASGSSPSGNSSSRSGSLSGDDSLDSANFNSVPSPQALGPPTKEDNMFDVLDPENSSTWQLELHQLRLANKKLKEELEQYEVKTKPKSKKHRLVTDVERICAHCLRKNSPEWRKGPDGPGTLCNSCGIKYAKSSSNGGGGSSSPERTKSGSQEQISS